MILTLINCAIGVFYLALMAVVAFIALRQHNSDVPALDARVLDWYNRQVERADELSRIRRMYYGPAGG